MRMDTIDERLALFRSMMERAGFDPQFPAATNDELRAGAQRCLGCRSGEACRDFLETAPEGASTPGFCRNLTHFAEWTERQASLEQELLDDAVHSLDR